MFAALKGGEKFSKLDLIYAYQKLKLDKETQEQLAHCGLYKLAWKFVSTTPLSEKVAVMQKYPISKNMTELKPFLRSLNYYNHHLFNLSIVIASFLLRMKKSVSSRSENVFPRY